MTLTTWLAFALGAGLGAPLRFLADGAVERRHSAIRPRGTLVVNAVGSLILGAVTGLALRGQGPEHLDTVVGVGFTGALTTFSTFAFETVRLLEAGEVEEALANIALQATIAIGLAALGYAVVLGLV